MSKRKRIGLALLGAVLLLSVGVRLAVRGGGEVSGLPPGFLKISGEGTAKELRQELAAEGLDADVECPELEAVVVGGGFVCTVTDGKNEANISVQFRKEGRRWVPTPNLAVPSLVRPKLKRDLVVFLGASGQVYEDLADWDPSKPLPVGTGIGNCPDAKAQFVQEGKEMWRCELVNGTTVLDSIALIAMPRTEIGFVWVSDEIADEMIDAEKAEKELFESVKPVAPDPLPFKDAEEAARLLMELAIRHSRPDVYNRGVDVTWQRALPGLNLFQGRSADPRTVVTNMGLDAEGLMHYVYTVRDATGRCAGGDLVATGGEKYSRGKVHVLTTKTCETADLMGQIGLEFMPEE